MGRLWFVVAACAAAAAPDASLSEVRSDCRKECKEVHRQLTPGKCRKLGRSLAREARAEASSACLAAFNRGLSDECEETCVASARGGADRRLLADHPSFGSCGVVLVRRPLGR